MPIEEAIHSEEDVTPTVAFDAHPAHDDDPEDYEGQTITPFGPDQGPGPGAALRLRDGEAITIPKGSEAVTLCIDGEVMEPGAQFTLGPDGTVTLHAHRPNAKTIALSWWDWQGCLRQALWRL